MITETIMIAAAAGVVGAAGGVVFGLMRGAGLRDALADQAVTLEIERDDAHAKLTRLTDRDARGRFTNAEKRAEEAEKKAALHDEMRKAVAR